MQKATGCLTSGSAAISSAWNPEVSFMSATTFCASAFATGEGFAGLGIKCQSTGLSRSRSARSPPVTRADAAVAAGSFS